MGNGYVYSIFGLDLSFLVHVRLCLVVIGGGISSKMEMASRNRDSSFLQSNETAKQHNCRLLVLKRNIQTVATGFALFTVVETSRFIG